MNEILTNSITHWKSSASSILTVTLATSAGLMTYPPVANHVKIMAALGGVQVVAKIWIGLISVDPGKSLAYIPSTGQVEAVASHEMPDNSNAIPISTPDEAKPPK